MDDPATNHPRSADQTPTESPGRARGTTAVDPSLQARALRANGSALAFFVRPQEVIDLLDLLRRLVEELDPFDYEFGRCYWCDEHLARHTPECPYGQAKSYLKSTLVGGSNT